jgi:transposase
LGIKKTKTNKETSMSKYSVKLNQEQRQMVEELVKKGTAPARKIQRANILLKTDSGKQGPRWSTKKIQEAFGASCSLIKSVRKRFVEGGIEDALNRRGQPERPEKRKIQGEQEAQIIALMCTEDPEGQERWTLRALTNRIIALEIIKETSYETVRMVLRKNQLKPWQEKQWCVGKTHDGNYAFHMEDVLEVYTRPYDPKSPQVCIDEGSEQFTKELIAAIKAKPGKIKKVDYQYERDGYCSIFLVCEPLTGKRAIHVTERRTKVDFAYFLRYVVDEMYPDAEKVVVVMDNLNTHTPGSLYEVFPPKEAMRIWKKVEIHYTPVHGSWLNMAEIELSVLGRQVLHERLGDIETVRQRVGAWQVKRNTQKIKINWRFTSDDARIKLKQLYPVIEECSPDEEKKPVEDECPVKKVCNEP